MPAGDGRISGQILTSMSQPIVGATVLLGLNDTGVPSESRAWWVAKTDQGGLYQFSDHPGGGFIVIAAGPAFPALAFATEVPRLSIDLVPAGRATEVDLTLHRPASISGRVVRSDGSAALDERVAL